MVMVMTFRSFVVYTTHNVTLSEAVGKLGVIMGMIDESV